MKRFYIKSFNGEIIEFIPMIYNYSIFMFINTIDIKRRFFALDRTYKNFKNSINSRYFFTTLNNIEKKQAAFIEAFNDTINKNKKDIIKLNNKINKLYHMFFIGMYYIEAFYIATIEEKNGLKVFKINKKHIREKR